MTEQGTPQVCIGLDLDSTPFRDNDPLADLERVVAEQNRRVGDDFITVVALYDTAPNPKNNSLGLPDLRHHIQGAITAVWRANNQSIADGSIPPIKLLLGNFGGEGAFEAQAVNAIVRARDSQHIVAVTGFGQSLDKIRQAAIDLSDHQISSIADTVSGDDMNLDPATHQKIQRFFRTTATNGDKAAAAVAYLAENSLRKVVVVEDINPLDRYGMSLGEGFKSAYINRYRQSTYTKNFRSPDTELRGMSRSEFMTKQFADMHGELCLEKPDMIYFAGRGADLRSFLVALSQGGACGLGPLDVVSGNDAGNILGTPLPNFGSLNVTVLYTTTATTGEWNDAAPAEAENLQNYNDFVSVFTGQHFGTAQDLGDGSAMTSHDAVLTAATAARKDPSSATDPATVSAFIEEFDCRSPIPGATGKIAFSPDSRGNPIDKAVPIIEIHDDGSPTMRDMVWAAGQPFDPAGCQ